MKQGLSEGGCRGQARRQLEAAAGYFENNLGRMDYWSYRRQHLPIGSGVTEAACKSVVKERMSGSGMKWKYSGASTILNLRTLLLSSGRWESFWSKISQYGC